MEDDGTVLDVSSGLPSECPKRSGVFGNVVNGRESWLRQSYVNPRGKSRQFAYVAPLVNTFQDTSGVEPHAVPVVSVSGRTPSIVRLDNQPVDSVSWFSLCPLPRLIIPCLCRSSSPYSIDYGDWLSAVHISRSVSWPHRPKPHVVGPPTHLTVPSVATGSSCPESGSTPATAEDARQP